MIIKERILNMKQKPSLIESQKHAVKIVKNMSKKEAKAALMTIFFGLHQKTHFMT
jgi:hypothetical protein